MGLAEKVRWHGAPMQGTIRRKGERAHTGESNHEDGKELEVFVGGELELFIILNSSREKKGTFGNFKIEVSIRFTVKCQVETVGYCSPFSIFPVCLHKMGPLLYL